MTKEEALRDNQMSKALHNENIIKELEKLKAELEPLPITDTAIRLVSELINNHIAELKGE